MMPSVRDHADVVTKEGQHYSVDEFLWPWERRAPVFLQHGFA